MAENPGPSRVKVGLALLAVYLIWGSTYLGIRLVVETIPPFLGMGLRFFTAGAILIAFALARGAKWPSLAEWKPAAITGTLLLLGGNGLVAWAEQTVPSGLTALILGSVPLWVVVLGWAGPGRHRPTAGVAAGLVLGIAGVALLVDPTQTAAEVPLIGGVVLLVACFLWSVGTLYGRTAKLPDPPLLGIAMEMTAGGAAQILAGVALGEVGRFHPEAVSTTSWVAFAYLILIGSLIGFTAYLWLIRNVAPTLATTYAFVNPVIAVILGFLILSEPITARTMIAAAVIIAAVAIITQMQARVAPSPASAPARAAAPEEPV